ncbi:hypothetical protein [Spirosoma flavum]|uniref:Uncharacterized protein n=1 Tax=Spirosoma flavum TaxID=2048557 RepID=A0ABW6AMU6_9BACT
MESPQKRSKSSVPAKFVLKKEALQKPENNELYKVGLEMLVKKQNEIITQRKGVKQKAAEALNANPSNHNLQNNLAQAIKGTHITKQEFINKLGKTFTVIDNIIHYKDVPIANLLDSDNQKAYSEVQAALAPGHSPVYKRVNLDGHTDKEYVLVNGAMIKRIAYRGITPPESELYRDKQPLTPYFIDNLTGETPGMHFNDDGTSFERKDFSKSDVKFLQSLGSIKNDAFPADEKGLLAFTQIRQGASKVLSATSTKQDIKSNHGQGFGKFGMVKIDLAKVPTTNVLHHYNVEAYDAENVKRMIQKINEQSIKAKYNDKNPAPDDKVISAQAISTINHGTVDDHVDRGNLSFIRNREILFTAIPFDSIIEYKPSKSKLDYNAAFRTSFIAKINALIGDDKYEIVSEDMIGDPNEVIAAYLKPKIQAYTQERGKVDGLFAAINHMNKIRKDAQDAENARRRKEREARFAQKPNYNNKKRY